MSEHTAADLMMRTRAVDLCLYLRAVPAEQMYDPSVCKRIRGPLVASTTDHTLDADFGLLILHGRWTTFADACIDHPLEHQFTIDPLRDIILCNYEQVHRYPCTQRYEIKS